MPRILRVNSADGYRVATVDSLDGVKSVVDGLGPGRYEVDEIVLGRRSSEHTVRRWCVATKQADGSVVINMDPPLSPGHT
jgi:hypothetical protein